MQPLNNGLRTDMDIQLPDKNFYIQYLTILIENIVICMNSYNDFNNRNRYHISLATRLCYDFTLLYIEACTYTR